MKKILIFMFSIFMVLSLSACGSDADSVTTVGELTRKLESKSDKIIAISEDIVLTEPIEIVGNKEIVGSGTITVSVADMEDDYVIRVADGAQLTIGGEATVDLSSLTGGIHVKEGATLVLQDNAVVTGASVKASNVLVEGAFTMNGGSLQLANGHNLINKNNVTIAGGKIKGSGSKYAAVYNEGTLKQDDGAIVGAYNNVVCTADSSFTWNKGEIKMAVGDAILIEKGASIHITSTDAKLTDAFATGLVVNGEGVIDGTTMTNSMASMIEVGHNGKLTINNGKISKAGVHAIDNAGELLIAGGIIYDNRESGVCNTGTFEMTGGSIMNSENKGVLNKAGTAKIVSEDVILSGNKFAIGNEEGAYFELSKAQLIQSATSNIFAYGGEMYIHDIALAPSGSTNTRVIAAKLIMEDMEIQGVSESADGGSHGLYMEGGAITAKKLIIRNTTGNAIRNKGGNFQGEDITIKDIKGIGIGCMNQAETDREGIVNIKNSTTENVQNNNVFVESGTCTLTNVTLGASSTNNVKTQDGTLILKNCTVNGNTDKGDGSNHAVYMVGGTIKATNTKFQNATGAILRINGEEAFFNGKKLTFKNSKVFGIFQTVGKIVIDDLTTSNIGQNNIMMDKGFIQLTNAKLGATTSNNVRLRNTGTLVLNDVEIQGHVKGTKDSEHVLFPTNGTLIGKNLRIHDVAGSAVRVNGEDVKVTLEDVEIDGATIAYNLTQGDVTVKNTVTKNVKQNNIMTWYENLDFTMMNATLGKTQGHSVRIQNGKNHFEDIKIQGTSEGQKGDYHGLFISKGTVTGKNVTISNIDASAVRVNGDADVILDRVDIQKPGIYGVFVNAGKTEIANMKTTDVPEFNIWINDAGTLTVKDSVLGKTGTHNVRITGGETYFENVDVQGTLEGREGDFHGLYINKGAFSCKDVTISDIDASAVRVNGDADVTLDGVEIIKPGMYGVFVNDGKTEIANMTTSGVPVHNIYINADGNLTVKDSVLGETESHNVKVEGGKTYFENVAVRGTSEGEEGQDFHGLYITKGSVSGKKVTLSDIDASALRVNGDADVTLDGVEIINPGMYGVFVNDGKTEIANMTTSGVPVHNIYINADGNLTVKGDSVLGKTPSHSVKVESGLLTLNEVTLEGTTGANDRHGLLLQGGTTTIDILTIKDIAGSAVRISGGSVKGKNVTIDNIGANGFAATGGTVELETVALSNVQNFNVQASQMGSVTLTSATLNASKGSYNVILEGDSPEAKVVLKDSFVTGRTDGGLDSIYAKSGTVELSDVTVTGYRYGIRVLENATAILNGVTSTGGEHDIYNLSKNLKLAGVINADIYNDAAVTVNATSSLKESNMTVDWPLNKLPEDMVGMQFEAKKDAQESNTVVKLGALTNEKYVTYFNGKQMLLVDKNCALYTVKNYDELVAAVTHMQANSITNAMVTVAGDLVITSEVTVPSNTSITLKDDGTKRTISRGSQYTGVMFTISESADLIVQSTKLVIDGTGENAEVDIDVKKASAEVHLSGKMIANVSHAEGSKLYVDGALTSGSAVVVDWKSDIPTDDEGIVFANEDLRKASEPYISLGETKAETYVLAYAGTKGMLVRLYKVSTLEQLNSALAAISGTANKNGIIRIANDIDVSDTITIPAGSNVIIENEGNEAKHLNKTSALSAKSMIQLGAGAALTLRSSGEASDCKLILDGKNVAATGTAPLICLPDNANATVNINKGVKLQNNDTKAYGSAVRVQGNGGTVHIDGAYFENNKATSSNGAALALHKSTSATIKNAVFKGNVASGGSGGAIWTSDNAVTCTITNTTFEKNQATGTSVDGGAIYIGNNANAVFTITDCKFTDNSAARAGGAICVRPNGKLILTGTSENAIVSGNSGKEGGAVAVGASGTLTIEGYKFTNNTATVSGGVGGAVWLNAASATIKDTTFTNNSAVNGGAVYMKGATTLTLEATPGSQKAKFVGNTVTTGTGSAIHVAAGTLTGSGYAFNPEYSETVVYVASGATNNYVKEVYVSTLEQLNTALTTISNATNKIGFIRLTADIEVSSTIEIPAGSNVTIENDGTARKLIKTSALSSAAMIKLGTGATLTLRSSGNVNDCKLILDGNNITATGNAPLINLPANANATVNINKGVKLQNNDTKGAGGVVRAEANSGTVHIDGAYFVNNKATGKEGAALGLWSGTTTTIQNAVFKGNIASGSNGGAIWTNTGGANCTITNTTFEDNKAMGGTANDGGAIFINANAVFTITDCKFTGNTATRTGGAIRNGGSLTLTGTSSNAIFSGNSGKEGGAVGVNTGTLTIEGYTFDKNAATADGGAIWLYKTTATIKDTTFISNEAVNGGAVYMKTNSTLTLEATAGSEKAKFENNTATGKGNAIYMNTSTLAGSGYTFTPAYSESVVAENGSTNNYND